MAGRVKDANIESPTARRRLKSGRNLHLQSLATGRVALGYQRWKGDQDGRWVLRRHIGNSKYRFETLGRADDAEPADGVYVLSYDQADAKARSAVDMPAVKNGKLTVRQATERYIELKQHEGRNTRDVETRAAVHIYPDLGDLIVSELTAKRLQGWLSSMAKAPAQSRPKDNKPKYRAAPVTDEDVRARRNTANRVLGALRAALNLAATEHNEILNHKEWGGKRLKAFKGVNTARVRYLTVDEAQHLLKACDPDLRALVRAGLETGARYGELGRLQVQDFNPDAGTLAIRKSKSGKPRHVILTEEGVAFFRQHCAGRNNPLMFTRDGGLPWKKSEQTRPMREASANAGITRVNFHALRHTWASLAVMAGTPLMVIARQLGHKDTRMVEKHYGHLAVDFIADAIRAGAPRFGHDHG